MPCFSSHTSAPRLKSRSALHDQRRGLRLVERYIQDILAAQPLPPRQCRTWWIMRQYMPITMVWVGVLWVSSIALAFWLGAHTDVPRFQLQLFRGAILGSMGIVWQGYRHVVQPMVRARRAVRFGWYTHAVVAEYTLDTTPASDVVKLLLFYEHAARDYEQLVSFRVPRQGHWIYAIAVGAQVHVLLHPHTPQILLTVGPVEAEVPGKNLQ